MNAADRVAADCETARGLDPNPHDPERMLYRCGSCGEWRGLNIRCPTCNIIEARCAYCDRPSEVCRDDTCRATLRVGRLDVAL